MKPRVFKVPTEVRLEFERLKRIIQVRDDEIAVLKETIDVLRDCLGSFQARANLGTALDKADTAALIAATKAKA